MADDNSTILLTIFLAVFVGTKLEQIQSGSDLLVIQLDLAFA